MGRVIEFRRREIDGTSDLTVDAGMFTVIEGYPDGACTSDDVSEARVRISWFVNDAEGPPCVFIGVQLPPLKAPWNIQPEESVENSAIMALDEAEELVMQLQDAIAKCKNDKR